MPIVPVKFKSDKEIEGELEKSGPIIKGPRSYIPPLFDVNDEAVNCLYCINKIPPTCDINEKKCLFIDCPDCTDDKGSFFNCDHYIKPHCKEGYPYSNGWLTCPVYDGPKLKSEIWFKDKKGKFHKIK